MSRLTRQFDVIAPDLACHGTETRIVSTFDELCEDLIARLRQARRVKVHLVGHSLGGAIAAQLARLGGFETQSLTLICPFGFGAQIDMDALHQFLDATSDEDLHNALVPFLGDPQLVSDKLVSLVQTERRRTDRFAFLKELAKDVFTNHACRFDLSDPEFKLLRCNVIWGEQDRVIPFRYGLNRLRGANFNLIKHVGHSPHLVCAPEVSKLIAATCRYTHLGGQS